MQSNHLLRKRLVGIFAHMMLRLMVLGFPLLTVLEMGAAEADADVPAGFVALFNGKDLSGWKGLVGNPLTRTKMSPTELATAGQAADQRMRAHWQVVDGVLEFDGKGDSLCTVKDYGDFEMFVDWKILPAGDSGIYLRGSPQVQIWDTEHKPLEKHGADKGSGSLWNNKRHSRFPLVKADNPVGQWNTFYIKMRGDRVTVKLNGKLVVDNVVLENYWDPEKPLPATGQIELQNHGNTLWFRNLYIRELPTEDEAAKNEPTGDAAVKDTAALRAPITPTEGPIDLLKNGLQPMYTWLKETKYDDPHEVYALVNGILRVSGQEWGGLTTRENYANYHMVCEFKWGDLTWANRQGKSRDSGILVHGIGPDGTYSGIWMASIEAQIIEGGVGDFLALTTQDPESGKTYPVSLTATIRKDRDGEPVWAKDEGTGDGGTGEEITISKGRINWWGRDPDWTDTFGFRGKQDVESPAGQWTRMEVICAGDEITILVNGVRVNHCHHVSPAAGKLLLQSEGAEIFVRRWELWPLGSEPE
jgi:hypothetical protein